MSSRLGWWWSGIALDVRWDIDQVRSFRSFFRMDVRCCRCREEWSFCTRWREFNRRKVKLRRAVTHPQPDRDREEEFMSRLARLFPEVPLRILERVPGKLNYDNDIMAINRRTRRQVERAETVILNLFSGPNTKIWTSHGQKGLLILNVEVLKGTDLLEKQLLRISRSTGPLWKVQRNLRWPTMQNSELLQIWSWPRWRATTS